MKSRGGDIAETLFGRFVISHEPELAKIDVPQERIRGGAMSMRQVRVVAMLALATVGCGSSDKTQQARRPAPTIADAGTFVPTDASPGMPDGGYVSEAPGCTNDSDYALSQDGDWLECEAFACAVVASTVVPSQPDASDAGTDAAVSADAATNPEPRRAVVQSAMDSCVKMAPHLQMLTPVCRSCYEARAQCLAAACTASFGGMDACTLPSTDFAECANVEPPSAMCQLCFTENCLSDFLNCSGFIINTDVDG